MANRLDKIKLVEQQFLRSDLPKLEVGDSLRMKIKVQEADKIRLHPFEGTVIRKTGGSLNATFTVRKISFGEGVEKTFPLHSPVIDSIQIVSKGKSKRSKLYYLRGRVGKRAKLQKEQEKQLAKTEKAVAS